MTMNIYVMQGRDYYNRPDNEVFQGSISTTSEFIRQSFAFRKLTDLLGDRDQVKLQPDQYSPLIPTFKEEIGVAEIKRKEFLRGRDKLKPSESNDQNLGIIYGGICLLYHQLVKCHRGLEIGKTLGKRIDINL